MSEEDFYSFDKESTNLEDLESRIEALEDGQSSSNDSNYNNCVVLMYFPGLVLAMILSYTVNQSILWAIIHGFLSWGYVIYRLFF